MITLNNERIRQMELDFEIDQERLDRLDWRRAIENNLHALQDYVRDDQLMIWQPGVLKRGRGADGFKAFDVQIATRTRCTCSRFKLRDRCEHIAFVKHLEASGNTPDTDTPIAAVHTMEGNEVAS